MNPIKFRIAAKTDVGLVRTNNEDNFQASSDLSGGQMRWINNEICSLGEKGALIVVADGMGGMNAGEVASELAIETIREYFSPDKLTEEVTKTRFSIEKYMNEAIVAADARIKAEASVRPETKGMGTTIVIGWILDRKLYISWCGDSRAYIYNPSAGLHQISKDHSYVQGLVDKGAITREEAFDFPDSNIITRCLSDSPTKARPESLLKPYELCNNDIIMLCTDGLSGMIRDAEIESIIKANEDNMDILVDELIKASCDAEGSDNITICLCQILQGGASCNPAIFSEYDKRLNGNNDNFIKTLIKKPEAIIPRNRIILYAGLAILALTILLMSIWWLGFRDKDIIKPADNTPDIETGIETSNPDSSENSMAAQGDKPDAATEKPGENSEVVSNGNGSGSIFNKSAVHDETSTEVVAEEVLTPIGEGIEDTGTTDDISEIKTTKYIVQKGDSYFRIAKKFKTKVKILQQLNNNVELKAGAEIIVPQSHEQE